MLTTLLAINWEPELRGILILIIGTGARSTSSSVPTWGPGSAS